MTNNRQEMKKKPSEAQKKYWASLKLKTGKKSPNYKKVVGKAQVHGWMNVHYGKAKVCEGKNCRKNATWYDWALKHGKKYERKRENFMRLCRSCHRIYDLTEEKRQQGMRNFWWKMGIKNPGKPNIQNLWWEKDIKKTNEYKKRKLST